MMCVMLGRGKSGTRNVGTWLSHVTRHRRPIYRLQICLLWHDMAEPCPYDLMGCDAKNPRSSPAQGIFLCVWWDLSPLSPLNP